MKKKYTSITTLSLLFCAAALGACGSDNGYYDSKGNYVSKESRYGSQTGAQYVDSTQYADHYEVRTQSDYPNQYAGYHRLGFYDHNGQYIVSDNALSIPKTLYPANGLCRVWFINRIPSQQPPIETCDDIKSRVPAGAYVIYGG